MARPLLPSPDIRKPVGLYLTEAERDTIEKRARTAGLALSTFARKSALGQRIASVPQPNAERWAELARLSGNLNQLAKAANEGKRVEVDFVLLMEVADGVRKLRLELLGAFGEDA